MLTLLDIAKMNGSDAVVGLVEEATRAHPELSIVSARTIRGLNFKTLVRLTLPTVGFRNANEGTALSQSTFENRLIEAFILNPPFEVDKLVADSHEDGWQAVLAMEGAGIMEASAQLLASQFYYGVANNAKGFPGLIAAYDATNMVVDAGGTTGGTGSSVWAVRSSPNHVQWVWGNGGQLALSEVSVVRVLDANNNPYLAYHQEIAARPGLQVSSIYSIGRIKKLTADAGKGLTDALLAQLVMKFPVGTRPDLLLMSRRSLGQLRASRTATNATGAPAPTPTEYESIPIYPTDAIVDTEALTL